MSTQATSAPDSPGRCLDLEEIAALVDGRMAADRRSEALAHLARCKACYEVFEETVDLVEALEQTTRERDPRDADGEPPAIQPSVADRGVGSRTQPMARRVPGSRRSRPLGRTLQLTALAAAAVLAVVLWRPWEPGRPSLPGEKASRASLDALTRVIAAPGALADRVGERWESPPWSGDRGGDGIAGDHELEFRLGARVVALHVALRTGERNAAVALGRQLEAMLGEVTATALLIEDYRSLSDELTRGRPPEQLLDRSVDNAARLERHLAGSPYFALGHWVMAGWLAARAGTWEHFTDPGVLDVRARLDTVGLSPVLVRELRAVDALMEDLPESGDLEPLAATFGRLLDMGR